MKNQNYHGIVPAFYACYEDNGSISSARAAQLAEYLIDKKVDALYVGGSSGECIYQTVAERKEILEAVIDVARGKIPVYAHVACNSIQESRLLAAHAEEVGVSAIMAIPPIYFHLPEAAIADYWNAISDAAPHTDFFIYNIPQLAGVALTEKLLRTMRKNPRVVGVKNSSMPVQDIQMWTDVEDTIVFNGPDEQLLSGLAAGAVGGIGGTYGVMPELYLKIYALFQQGEMEQARRVQNEACRIIYTMCSAKANLYAVMKEILKTQGVNIGTARQPLPGIQDGDMEIVEKAAEMIKRSVERYCH